MSICGILAHGLIPVLRGNFCPVKWAFNAPICSSAIRVAWLVADIGQQNFMRLKNFLAIFISDC
jgi:hypothetical protein